MAGPALAHGFSSTVYADVTPGESGHVRTALELEYDLLVVSAADYRDDDQLFQDGTAAFDAGDAAAQAAALNAHSAAALGYVTDRFSVTAGGDACAPSASGPFTLGTREGVPYTTLVLDWTCAQRTGEHEIRSGLFPDAETYVRDTKTIVTYEIDGRDGSAALDAGNPVFSTAQSWQQRFGEFFVLGAEHLLFGIDHILFLLALIAGSRRLREIVLAATAFTVAHSVTFVLAALGLVSVPARVVEPIIALSIAVVAGWHLVQVRRGGSVSPGAGWGRLAVVFLFGLVHGLGFAGALGIDEAWSWTLLWSLLVFNVGIESVQIGLILLVFPALTLLRRRAPRAGNWVTGLLCAGVAVMGLIWFVERIFAS
ncbi:hydrogenase/urease accessory protein HupE [Actinoplanes lutulentus]|uniref:Hydrogenase/urease accessory protein HupE n=2 Tax=Actinoplanes lutulentus TaxID=1287878 RepID=A0A327ZD81_9ACTN|nr:hydrogenase/urease accessory protein HupE [Actinoplanes lutulentus]